MKLIFMLSMRSFFVLSFLFLSFHFFGQNKPVINNFRVENSNKSRVYFDVEGDISGLITQGFIISGKSISGVSTNGNYFTVSSPFTFWDNNTIRLESGNGTVYDFTLQNIQNNIVEPTAATYKYVSLTGSNGNSGDSEGDAWRTIDYAVDNVSAGTTIWVKAGNYGNENVTISANGTTGSPIKVIGYQATPGDNPNLNWDISKTTPWDINNPLLRTNGFDSSIMPLLSGSNELINRGINITGSFIIVKNIQAENYSSVFTATAHNDALWMDNCYASQGMHTFYFSSENQSRKRFTNCLAFRGRVTTFRVYGSHNRIEDCEAWDDRSNELDGNDYSNDYFFSYFGNDNILRGNHMQRIQNDSPAPDHGGHGYSNKRSDGGPSQYNLLENSTAIDLWTTVEFWHSGVQNNVVRNVTGIRLDATDTMLGILVSGNATNNILENCKFDGQNYGTYYTTSGITGIEYRNCIFSNMGSLYRAAATITGNKYDNCTMYNLSTLVTGTSSTTCTFDVTNTIFSEVGRNGDTNFNYTYSDFYNSGTVPSGTGNISLNPNFSNAANGDFTLSETTSSIVYAGGTNLSNVKYGKNGVERENGKYSIGAYQKNSESTGSVTANAGADQNICLGENVTLTASGGSSYSWSNGATTQSITVSPLSTTTYTVTVSDGSSSDSDDVIVTVNTATANAGSNVTINEGNSTILNASGGDSYLWDTGATTQNITVSPNSTRTYTVTVTKNGCTDTDTVQVTVNPTTGSVTANAGTDQAICQGESATLTASGGSSYSWSTGATTQSIAVSPNTTQTYTVTVSDGSGNSDSDDVIITVNSVTANAGSDKTIDEGDSVTLTASGGDSYLWSNGATTQSITVNPNSTTNYTVTASKNTCSDSDTVQVTVNIVTGTVNANAGADITICGGDEGTMLTASGGSTYLWNTGATTQSISVNPATTQTYTVTVSDGTNSDSDDVTVTVINVTADAGPNQTIDQGDSIILTANGGDSYSWSNGANSQSITVSPNTTTNYTVTATKNGCQDTDTVQVTVNAPPPVITANAGTDVSICNGDSTTLTASGGTAYVWNTGETTQSITVNPSTTLTYTVTVSDGSTSDTDDVIVSVTNVTANAGTDKTINQGETVKLTASGGDTYLWSTGATTRSITVSPASTLTYSVTVNKNGCQDVDDVIVTVESIITNPAPAEAFAGDDISICLGESVVLTASGGESYLWSTGDTENTINVNPTRTTTYTLSATRGGTTDTDTVIVTVENCSSSFDTIKDENSSFVVYPNPTDGNITIDLKMKSTKEDFNIFIVDQKGSVVLRDKMYSTQSELFKELNLSSLAKGVYYVRLVNSKRSLIKKIIYI